MLVLAATLAGTLTVTVSHAAIAISSETTSNMSCTAGVCTPTAAKAVLNVDELTGMLSTGDTTIKSTNLNQDIEVDAKLSWIGAHRLTLDAYRSIAFNKPMHVIKKNAALTITTNDGGTGGDFRFFGSGHVTFQEYVPFNLVINGHDYFLVKNIKQLAKRRNLRRHPYIALMKSYEAAGDGTYAHSPVPDIGNFEGLGNVISNLSIDDSTNNDAVGLFASLQDALGAWVVRDFGIVEAHVHASGTNQVVGILAGRNPNSLVEYCFATGDVSVGSGSTIFAGGLIGGTSGLSPSIFQSYASVDVSGGSSSVLGGLVGIVADGSLAQSFATGSVSGGDNSIVGGLFGESTHTTGLETGVFDSYATGAVTGGSNARLGGLIGSNGAPFQAVPIEVMRSFSTGLVDGGSGATAGALIGQDLSQANTDTYWDLDTSGISDPSGGAGNVSNDPGITGLTDTQLKSSLPTGFNKKVWKQSASINGGYPYLAGNPPPR